MLGADPNCCSTACMQPCAQSISAHCVRCTVCTACWHNPWHSLRHSSRHSQRHSFGHSPRHSRRGRPRRSVSKGHQLLSNNRLVAAADNNLPKTVCGQTAMLYGNSSTCTWCQSWQKKILADEPRCGGMLQHPHCRASPGSLQGRERILRGLQHMFQPDSAYAACC